MPFWLPSATIYVLNTSFLVFVMLIHTLLWITLQKTGSQDPVLRSPAHPVLLQKESGISIFEILTLVLVSLAGAKCEPALSVNVSKKWSRKPFMLEFLYGGINRNSRQPTTHNGFTLDLASARYKQGPSGYETESLISARVKTLN